MDIKLAFTDVCPALIMIPSKPTIMIEIVAKDLRKSAYLGHIAERSSRLAETRVNGLPGFARGTKAEPITGFPAPKFATEWQTKHTAQRTLERNQT